jgi:hypothetical protein
MAAPFDAQRRLRAATRRRADDRHASAVAHHVRNGPILAAERVVAGRLTALLHPLAPSALLLDLDVALAALLEHRVVLLNVLRTANRRPIRASLLLTLLARLLPLLARLLTLFAGRPLLLLVRLAPVALLGDRRSGCNAGKK